MTTYTAHEVLGGVYEKTVKMTVSRRLRYAPYAQAGWTDTVTRDSSGKKQSHTAAGHEVYLLLSGRDWIDSDTGEVVYAGGAAV